MRRSVVLLMLVLSVDLVAQGRLAPPMLEFDAASIKRSIVPEVVRRPRSRFLPGRFVATNVTLRYLTRLAYGTVAETQIVGGPSWFDVTRFDVTAVGAVETPDRVRLSLQQLLKSRFSMSVRTETREIPVYRLVRSRRDGRLGSGLIAKSCDRTQYEGLPEPPCGRFQYLANELRGMGVTMAELARFMPQASVTDIDRFVVDQTGLTETYNVAVRFSPLQETYGLFTNPGADLPPFSVAIQQDLGLRLKAGRGQAPVVVVERASLPEDD
jgi:uncharacterized protein (TIGR03435 family)